MSMATSITVRVPLTIRRRPGRRTVVTPASQQGDTFMPTRADPALVKALARAFRYERMLEKGRYASISEMAAAERIDRGYLGRILQLTLLAPDIVDAILNGRRMADPGLANLMASFPTGWEQQSAVLGGIAGLQSRSSTMARRTGAPAFGG